MMLNACNGYSNTDPKARNMQRSITSCFNQKKNKTHVVQNQTPCCKFTEISYNTENSQDFVCYSIQLILPPKVGMHGTVHVKSARFYNFHSYHKKYHLKRKKLPPVRRLVNVLPETSVEVGYNTFFCTTFQMDKFHKKKPQTRQQKKITYDKPYQRHKNVLAIVSSSFHGKRYKTRTQ